MARLALIGDVMLGRNVADAIETHGPGHPIGSGVAARLAAADAVWANLECVIADVGEPEPGRTFHFRAPPTAIETLERAAVSGVSLANNHVLDFGGRALEATLDHLTTAGIAHAGAGRTVEEAWQPATVPIGDAAMAVVAFTDNVPAWAIERRQPGLAFSRIDPEAAGITGLERTVTDLSREVSLVVVSAHWGPNMRRVPPETFRRVARTLVDAGADVFWGHSAHLFQAIERHAGGVILYDTGDFVDDYRIDPDEHNEISFLFEIEVVQGRIGGIDLLPVQIDPRSCRVELADPSAAAFARERMQELCGRFDTQVESTDEGGLRVPATST